MDCRIVLRERIALWCAWTFPSFLAASTRRTVLESVVVLVISVAPAGVMASLPERALKIACVVSVLVLPFTLWWCGFAAIDHAGPGLEAARAVAGVNFGEVTGAAGIVFREPRFVIAVVGHCVFLLLACRSALLPKAARVSLRWKNGRQLALLLSLLPLSLSAVFAMDDFHDHKAALFGAGTLSSPLGSATEILVDEARLSMQYRELGYRRRSAEPGIRITAPTLAIFIIGESARAQAYGADQAGRGPASWELDQRIKRGLGSWLPTTCASSDGTYLSVPLLLTATRPEQRDEAPLVPTILGILKASGFTTAWLANNEAGKDARETGHDLYAGPWTENPDHPDDTKIGKHWRYDEDMMPVTRSFIGNVDRPVALILHTYGNHNAYKDRYPEQFFPVEPPLLSSDALEDLRYARAAEYGARTILQVAAILDATSAPAFLVYTSDHGENLHSDHNGVEIHLGPRTTVEDGTVPSFVLWNEAMRKRRAPLQALSKLTSATMIAHVDVAKLFLVLAGVMAGPVQPTRNPTTWGRITVGDEYSPVRCSALKQ